MPAPLVSTAVFDFGGTLCLPLAASNSRAMARQCGLAPERFSVEFLRERLAYDLGERDLRGYWSRILAVGGRAAEDGLLEALNREDVAGWGRVNDRMLAWAGELRAAGLRTGILSNMPQPLLDAMRADAAFGWLRDFEVQVFSCEVHLVKPDARIYRHLLSRVGEEPGRCVFLDDDERNAAGARAIGIRGIHFQSPAQAAGEASALGLPVSSLLAP